MAEKIYPSSKPTTGPPPPTTGNPSFPATKAQQYNTSRPVYRPQPRRSRRSCCCSLCLWLTLTMILLILLAAIAGGIFYVIYRPHRPTFAISALHVTQLNLTSADKLTTKFNFTVTAKNPNKKISLYYDLVSVSFRSNNVDVGDGTIAAFTLGKKNTTALKTTVSTVGQSLDNNSNDSNNKKLKSDLKDKKSLVLKIQLDTKVKAKIGSFKTRKMPIRVTCDGIKAVAPTGKTATTATVSGEKCKVDLRIKIWKWTV